MTKFEELTDIITRNKNKGNNKAQLAEEEFDDDQEIEVAGSEKSKAPLVSFATDETDMDLTDQLYHSAKHKPTMGEGSYWVD